MRKGFTLAEVLITLGIIGVVAAMTIPILISNTRGARYRAQFKKTLSTMNQAVKLNESHYGFDFTTREICYYKKTAPKDQYAENFQTYCAIFNSNLAGATYLGTGTEVLCKDGQECYKDIWWWLISAGRDFVMWTLADGSIIAVYGNHSIDCSLPIGQQLNENWIRSHHRCLGFIDINGKELPNQVVKCSNKVTTKLAPNEPCVVKNNKSDLGDVFPIIVHDGVVEPATNASKYILNTAK